MGVILLPTDGFALIRFIVTLAEVPAPHCLLLLQGCAAFRGCCEGCEQHLSEQLPVEWVPRQKDSQA